MRIIIVPFLYLLLSVVIASAECDEEIPKARHFDVMEEGFDNFTKHADQVIKVALSALKPVKPVDERKPVIAHNAVAQSVKNISTTKVNPKSISGAKVIAAKTGKVVQVVRPSNTTKASDVTTNKMQISDSVSPVCPRMDHRKPWSKASKEERNAWMKAIRCTYDIPGTFHHGNVRGKNLAEDFGLVHNYLKIAMHNDPSFFPCHRLFTLNWLKRLRKECHYEGDSLYLDVNTYTDEMKFFKSQDLWGYDNLGSLEVPVNGKWTQDLYFNFIGTRRNDSTDILDTPQTLNRGAFELKDDGTPLQLYMQTQLIKQALAIDNYNIFRREVEKKIHDAFHNSIKRTMFPGTSPYDAFIFFPFHSFIDCIWLKWQEQSKDHLLAYNGLHRGTEQAVSIKDGCAMLGLGDDMTVADVLDASENPGCFDCPNFLE